MDWGYPKKVCTITGSTVGAQTGYTFLVKVHYGSGTDSATDVYLDNQCKTDFSDLRFALMDASLLYYAEIEKVNSDYCLIGFKTDTPTSPNTIQIYMYYGNPSATSLSNLSNATLEPSDDFEDGSLNAMWTAITQSSDSVTEASGYVRVSCPHAAWHSTRVRASNSWASADYKRVMMKARTSQIGDSQKIEQIIGSIDLANLNVFWFIDSNGK